MSWCSRATIRTYTGYKLAKGTDKIEYVGWQIISSIWKVQGKQENSNFKENGIGCLLLGAIDILGKKNFKAEDDQKFKLSSG